MQTLTSTGIPSAGYYTSLKLKTPSVQAAARPVMIPETRSRHSERAPQKSNYFVGL